MYNRPKEAYYNGNSKKNCLHSNFDKIYRIYSAKLHRHCIKILRDQAEAEDAVQETFLRAYRAREKFHFGDNPFKWLCCIGTNSCLMILRTRRRKSAIISDSIDQIIASDGNPERRLGARQVLEKILLEMDECGLKIVIAHYLFGMSQGEVAEQLGISRRAVVKRLSSMRNRYEEQLEKGSFAEYAGPTAKKDVFNGSLCPSMSSLGDKSLAYAG